MIGSTNKHFLPIFDTTCRLLVFYQRNCDFCCKLMEFCVTTYVYFWCAWQCYISSSHCWIEPLNCLNCHNSFTFLICLINAGKSISSTLGIKKIYSNYENTFFRRNDNVLKNFPISHLSWTFKKFWILRENVKKKKKIAKKEIISQNTVICAT